MNYVPLGIQVGVNGELSPEEQVDRVITKDFNDHRSIDSSRLAFVTAQLMADRRWLDFGWTVPSFAYRSGRTCGQVHQVCSLPSQNQSIAKHASHT